MDGFTYGFKALSDLSRLRALRMLLTAEGPVCVCELADALGLPQYQISKRVAILRQACLVTDSRIGTWVCYSIPTDAGRFGEGLYSLVKDSVDEPAKASRKERRLRHE